MDTMILKNNVVISEFHQLIFTLDKSFYGFPIASVKEVIGVQEVIKIPTAPHFMKGIIDLRGTTIPIVDLRLKLDMNEKPSSERTCIIILTSLFDGVERLTGVVVDEIQEVVEINSKDVEPAPKNNYENEYKCIRWVAKLKNEVVMLLDVEQLLDYKLN